MAATPGFGQNDSGVAGVSTPQGDVTAGAGQGNQEAARTPGTMTQDEWDALMQPGSVPPTSTKTASGAKTTGRKQAVRPVLKKQRVHSIVLD